MNILSFLPLLVLFTTLVAISWRIKKTRERHQKENSTLREKYAVDIEFPQVTEMGNSNFSLKIKKSTEALRAYYAESGVLQKQHDKESNIFHFVLLPSLLFGLVCGYAIILLFAWGANDWKVAAEGSYVRVEYTRGRGTTTAIYFEDGRTFALEGAYPIAFPRGTEIRILCNNSISKECKIEKIKSPD